MVYISSQAFLMQSSADATVESLHAQQCGWRVAFACCYVISGGRYCGPSDRMLIVAWRGDHSKSYVYEKHALAMVAMQERSTAGGDANRLQVVIGISYGGQMRSQLSLC